MSERELSLYIVDILIAINKIGRYTARFINAVDFLHSELEWDASLRELQIIGDAVNMLLKHQFINDTYRKIVDFRNQITHAYFGIDEEIVWEVITKKLRAFNDDLIAAAAAKNLDLTKGIEAAIKENSHNKKILKFLNEVKKKPGLK